MNTEITINTMLSNDIVLKSPVLEIEGFTRIGKYVVMRDHLYHDIVSLCEIIRAEFWLGGSGRFVKLKLRGEMEKLVMVKMMMDSYG